MELYYCKVKTGANFGDDLNVWLWPQLFKKDLHDCFDDQTLFVGIGTILNDAIPKEYNRKIIFSSGTGYGAAPQIDDTWDVWCVRGPLTADKLGLPADRAITDGAILLHKLVTPSSTRKGVGFIPHHQTAVFSDWEIICDGLGLKYIDPRGSVTEILENINNCELLITEAMHGAIVADVLRIPWHAIKTRKEILDFKWHDWTSSMGLKHRYTLIPPVVNQGKRRFLKPANAFIAKRRIKKILDHSRPQLSKDNILDTRYDEMMSRLAKLIDQA